MKIRILLGAALFATLSGCAVSQLTPAQLQEANDPLICSGKEECDLFWQRAQIYIANHSFWKIQIANDVVIQTYGPGQYLKRYIKSGL